MVLDLELFSSKLTRYCKQYLVDNTDITMSTGIPSKRLVLLMEGKAQPTGDEILILADYFKCDFKFFISNEMLAPFEQTDELFRRHGGELSREDRWSIQEFLFLCECQDFLIKELNITSAYKEFSYQKSGTFHKQQGIDAANKLRAFLSYKDDALPTDIFSNFRDIGIHIFRRKLGQSAISGIYIRHPVAGHCVLVNYDEDVYRQRFTVAHEAAHAILDNDAIIVSKKDSLSRKVGGKWTLEQLSEIRANNFAATYLAPEVFLKNSPNPEVWNVEKILEYSKLMHINPETLSIALFNASLISEAEKNEYSVLKIQQSEKEDIELPKTLSVKGRARKLFLLQKGLSDYYVSLCFDAYYEGIITQGRLAEMLLCGGLDELLEICNVYNQKIDYGY